MPLAFGLHSQEGKYETMEIEIQSRPLISSSCLRQVKQGAENMIQSLTSGHRDKKLLQEAQQMLDDSRAKIEFLRMRIMKVRQARQQQQRGEAPPPNGEATSNKGTARSLSNTQQAVRGLMESVRKMENVRVRISLTGSYVILRSSTSSTSIWRFNIRCT